jgi:hypothetical protein
MIMYLFFKKMLSLTILNEKKSYFRLVWLQYQMYY